MNNVVQPEVMVASEGDIVTARKVVRSAAAQLGFAVTDITRIVTAASELARNVFHYAGSGTLRWQSLEQNESVGIELVFIDHGPGIANIEQAMEPGFSTSGGLGLGLPGVKRLMDEMQVQSEVSKGTTIIVRKWRRK